MREAKYYIYRNLRTGGFSVKYRGIVIEWFNTFAAYGVSFKVSKSGRQRVLDEKRKNVHAYVVCDKYIVKKYPAIPVTDVDKYLKISYNPYKADCFVCDYRPITQAQEVLFQNGQCLLIR